MFNTTKSRFKVKIIKKGEPDFSFSHDGVVLTPRASLEISDICPCNMRLTIERAILDGYLRPVAYMKESEYIWEKLGE